MGFRASGRFLGLPKIAFKMKHILIVLGVVASWVQLFLIITALCHPNSSIPCGWVGFREPQGYKNDATYHELSRLWTIKIASASANGEEDSEDDKKDDEDQGQNRLWDAVLLG